MEFKTYIVSLCLGLVAFWGTMWVLTTDSIDSTSINAKVLVVDQISSTSNAVTTVDTLNITSNELGLKRHQVIGFNQNENKNINAVTYKQLSVSKNPNFLLWMLVIAFSIGMSIAILPFLFFVTKDITSKTKKTTSAGLSLLAVTLMAIVFIGSGGGGPEIVISGNRLMQLTGILLAHPGPIITSIIFIMFLPALFCLRGNFLIMHQMLTQIKNLAIGEVVELQKTFSKLLIVSSACLVLAVVTTSFLRLSILDVLPDDFVYLFPQHFVAVYGLVFTFFLIIFYLPGEFVFGIMVKQKIEGLSKEEAEEVETTVKAQSMFKLSLTVLGPAIMSILLEGLNFL